MYSLGHGGIYLAEEEHTAFCFLIEDLGRIYPRNKWCVPDGTVSALDVIVDPHDPPLVGTLGFARSDTDTHANSLVGVHFISVHPANFGGERNQ